MRKRTNEVLEDHGDWLLIDISTKKHPHATMAADTGAFALHLGGKIYAARPARRKYIIAMYEQSKHTNYFHRDVMPTTKEVDHIRHGTMSFIDNRISNLREVTSSQNSMNCSIRSDSKTGIAGVTWDKSRKKWQAYITINYKIKNLGRYDNIDFAIGARQQAEKVYFGEYAFNANNGEK